MLIVYVVHVTAQSGLVQKIRLTKYVCMQISSPLDSCPEDDICAVQANISIFADNTSPYALAFAAYWATANSSFQASYPRESITSI